MQLLQVASDQSNHKEAFAFTLSNYWFQGVKAIDCTKCHGAVFWTKVFLLWTLNSCCCCCLTLCWFSEMWQREWKSILIPRCFSFWFFLCFLLIVCFHPCLLLSSSSLVSSFICSCRVVSPGLITSVSLFVYSLLIALCFPVILPVFPSVSIPYEIIPCG